MDDIDLIKDRIVKELNWNSPIFLISAIDGQGCKDLTRKIMEYIDTVK